MELIFRATQIIEQSVNLNQTTKIAKVITLPRRRLKIREKEKDKQNVFGIQAKIRKRINDKINDLFNDDEKLTIFNKEIKEIKRKRRINNRYTSLH